MRVMVVSPGPGFSVEDVYQGWVRGLRAAGAEVGVFDLGVRQGFFQNAFHPMEGIPNHWVSPYSEADALVLAADQMFAEIYKGWPDVVLIVSALFIPPEFVPLMRVRGQKVVTLFTESPYEDDQQARFAEFCDLSIVNDPQNLDLFPAGSYYQPHSYDPAIHHMNGRDERYDFSFVGSGYPSRQEFFAQVDWTGIDATFGGYWPDMPDDHPIRPFLMDDPETCVDNRDTADLYRRSAMSANLYRKESNRPDLSAGWAMGPREVELAACGTFFLRDPRPESDELFPMLPSFDGPGEFSELLQWWSRHPAQREAAAIQAARAVETRTFELAARRLLNTLNQ